MQKRKAPKALVIVAHPDDETIWMGGKIMREKDWQWTVLSLCRKDDPDRKPKFFQVMELLNCRAFMSDLEDEHPEQKLPSLEEVRERVEPVIDDKEFDFVFTHGANGEYGHNRHIETHNAVKQMAQDGSLNCKKVFCFDYLRRENPFMCVHNANAPIKVRLSREEHERKRYLIHNVYGFQENGFEFMSCDGIEGFRECSGWLKRTQK